MARNAKEREERLRKLRTLPKVEGASEEGGVVSERALALVALRDRLQAPPNPDDPLAKLGRDSMASVVDASLVEAAEAARAAIETLARWTKGERLASRYTEGYLRTRALREGLAALVSEAGLLEEAYVRLATDAIEGEGLANCRLADGRGVTATTDAYPVLKDKAAFRAWVEERGEDGVYLRPGLVTALQLHWGSLKTLCEERLLEGEEPPPGVELFQKPAVRLLS